ncbi:Permease of the drug/metabolite transporter (DMT) superfamily [Pseudovibrio ascidiaceicola]|uniref:Permease of the drug/metabolite transporter (DMT) superfamily n=1 Tax=Pseudovibrio ascidiaceicola TaxID=285279 RepID=A0A1I3X0S2_9HYPH|nr:EamA family transporter [Pseudovibrio ascidiaceicola]SFK13235.1 Permease of the drug/metabolite transporter (DMT) superfamily [Pseudovibrio ascidiaceicola]
MLQNQTAGKVSAATSIGSISIVLWGTLAVLTKLTGDQFPPFQLLAMTFTVATLTLSGKLLTGKADVRSAFKLPLTGWLLGVGGLFGFHALYFVALQNAPAVEAGLIAYIWPLLIVLFSALLPGETITKWHVGGALVALAGYWVLLGWDSSAGNLQWEYVVGYVAAAGCALIWSSYSVLSRLIKNTSSDAVIGYCALTAVFGWLAHFLWETTAVPQDLTQIIAVIGLGLGPVGIAFYTWDFGVKHGNVQLLGVLAYGAPLISTLLLIVFGEGTLAVNIVIAALAIAGGSLIAAKSASKY